MKLTKVGIALVAVLALSGLTASAASALTFNASTSPVMLLGTQGINGHTFSMEGQTVKCTSVTFAKSSQTTPANEISGVEAFYNNCTAFGFAGATVNMGTCTYAFTAKISLKCNNNSNNGNIKVIASGLGSECEIHVSEQNDKININYANDTPNAGLVRATISLTGITATKTKDNGLCPLSGTGTINNATYNGETDVEATGGATIGVN